MSSYLDIKEASELLDCSRRHVRRLCKSGRLRGAISCKGGWKIPTTADTRLVGIKTPEELSASAELLNVPVEKRNEAIRRLGIIKDLERHATAIVRGGGTRTEALRCYVDMNGHKGVSKRSLERWLAKYRDQGLVGLVDTRGGGKFLSKMIDVDAFELFKTFYLDQKRLSVKACLDIVSCTNRKEQRGWKVPALAMMYRFVKREIPLPMQILHREGLAAYEAKCAPYIVNDPDSVQPGQIWIGDHHQMNCWVRHHGKWVRPWITVWQDMRSRCVIGWHLSASPNQTTILLAMKRGIEKYGPPDSVKIDNGRDYDSEMWTGVTKSKRKAIKAGYIDEMMVAGIYAMMDIGVSFSIPYHPQSKRIERWFDTLDMQFTKMISTYCGKDSGRRPDYLNDLLKSEKAIASAHTFESFTKLLTRYIDNYNKAAHSGDGMNDRSPADVLASRTSRRMLAEGVVDLLLRVWSRELVVGKNGVKFKGMWYGQYSPDLFIHQGKTVRLSYDPDDLRRIYIYDAVTLKLVTIAEQGRLIGYGSKVSEEALRDASRQKSRALKITKEFRNSRLAVNMDLPDLAMQAMEDGRKHELDAKEKLQTVRPVATAMDGQVREHERVEAVKAVKKAAGAESISKVLDIDFSVLSNKRKAVDLKLFNNGG